MREDRPVAQTQTTQNSDPFMLARSDASAAAPSGPVTPPDIYISLTSNTKPTLFPTTRRPSNYPRVVGQLPAQRNLNFMASPAQIAASRQNSQKSTGPRTVEGKRRSSLNALTFGLFSNDIRQLFSDEDRIRYDDFIKIHSDAFLPKGPTKNGWPTKSPKPCSCSIAPTI